MSSIQNQLQSRRQRLLWDINIENRTVGHLIQKCKKLKKLRLNSLQKLFHKLLTLQTINSKTNFQFQITSLFSKKSLFFLYTNPSHDTQPVHLSHCSSPIFRQHEIVFVTIVISSVVTKWTKQILLTTKCWSLSYF